GGVRGRDGADALRAVRWPVQRRADACRHRHRRRAGVADGEISVHRRSLDGIEPSRLPLRNGGPRGRCLLVVHKGQVHPIHVRLLSGQRTVAAPPPPPPPPPPSPPPSPPP